MSIQILNSTLQIEADAITTLALAALLLLLGAAVKNRVRILNHYCIPAPVVGGFLFMFFNLPRPCDGEFPGEFRHLLSESVHAGVLHDSRTLGEFFAS